MNKYLLIITAGGTGKRFGKTYPKQLTTVFSQPILEKTAFFFEKIKPLHCVITYPDGFLSDFEKALSNIPYKIDFIKGGKERFHSVKNALNYFIKKGFDKNLPVLVHDGVRPFLNLQTVEQIIKQTTENTAAVPYISVVGTMRKLINGKFCETIPRENAVIVTTPQGCKLGVLQQCFEKSKKEFTDESTLLSYFNIKITPVVDWEFNLKITTKKDLETATILWKKI
jgi:2-C-methyl-D-erythritol 4-phosphate cytidylyltransferase